MIRRLLPLVCFMLLAGLLVGVLYKKPVENNALLEKSLPDISLPALSGPDFSTDPLRGKTTILNFFAHWCTPCLAEHALLKELTRKTGIPIYGIAWKDDPEKLRAWLKKNGSPYRQVGLDPEGKALLAFGASGVPETYLLSREGRITYHVAGPLTPEILEEEIFPRLQRLQHAP